MTVAVSAHEVRSFFLADPKRQARLSESAKRALVPGTRGALPREVVKEHNRRRPTRQYAPGNTTALKAQGRAEAKALRAALRKDGVAVGKRGPLPKSVLGG